MLISVGMVCSCQKKDSAAEQQLAQWKTEMDARDEELVERLNSLDEKVNSLDERVKKLAEKTTMNARTSRADVQRQTSDPAQVQAERDRFIQQLSTMRESAQEDVEKAEKEREIQRAQKLPGLGQLQNQQQLGADELERQRQLKLKATGASPTPQ